MVWITDVASLFEEGGSALDKHDEYGDKGL
jgi:hypothetical protein